MWIRGGLPRPLTFELNDGFADPSMENEMENEMELENEPSAWLVPRLVNFANARNVHFTRQEGCTMTDKELKDYLSGTVQWSAEVVFLNDGAGYVEDKYGVKHYATPLYKRVSKKAEGETNLSEKFESLREDNARLWKMIKDAQEASNVAGLIGIIGSPAWVGQLKKARGKILAEEKLLRQCNASIQLSAENPADGRSASNGELGISLALLWNLVPESLPPDPDGGWFSPTVWLALSDGRVMPGRCLHKKETSECEAPVRDWFIEEDGKSCQIDKVVDVLAWMPFAVPNHPHFESAVKLIPNVELTGAGG